MYFRILFALLVSVTFILVAVTNATSQSENTSPNYVAKLQSVLDDSEGKIDILEIKTLIDKLIAPESNQLAVKVQVSQMVAEINSMLTEEMSDWKKAQILRKYIYDSGSWNANRPFSYDMADPQGIGPNGRRLDHYLETRKGNCVSMPVLHTILGQRLGLNMTISTAPLHIFVRYTDANGEAINIEATSGGYPARTAWYQKELPMLPEAVQNGMYMKSLSSKEVLAVLGQDLASHLLRSGQYEDSVLVSEKLIELFPNYGPVYMTRGSALYKIVERDFQSKYPDIKDVPEDEYSKLQFLLKQNMISFQTAEELGWRDPDQLKKELQAKQ